MKITTNARENGKRQIYVPLVSGAEIIDSDDSDDNCLDEEGRACEDPCESNTDLDRSFETVASLNEFDLGPESDRNEAPSKFKDLISLLF